MHGCNIKGRTFAEHVFPPGKMPGLYKRAWFTTWMVAWSCGSNCFTVLKANIYFDIYIFWERCVDHICSRQGVSVSLSLSCSVSDLCQRWWISCFSIRQAACLDVHLFLFLKWRFPTIGYPEIFFILFSIMNHPTIGVPPFTTSKYRPSKKWLQPRRPQWPSCLGCGEACLERANLYRNPSGEGRVYRGYLGVLDTPKEVPKDIASCLVDLGFGMTL